MSSNNTIHDSSKFIKNEIASLLNVKPNANLDDIARMLSSPVNDQNPQTSIERPNSYPVPLNVNQKNPLGLLKWADLSLDDMPNEQFHGLSSYKINNWMTVDFDDLQGVKIKTPDDLSNSPVMRYLDIICEYARNNGCQIPLTPEGCLPRAIVRDCRDVLEELPQFAFPQLRDHEFFMGKTEFDFKALHYTRVLMEGIGICHEQDGILHFPKCNIDIFLVRGVWAFYRPMLWASIYKLNWESIYPLAYDFDIQELWLYATWRMGQHGEVETLYKELASAFPHLIKQCEQDENIAYAYPNVFLEQATLERFILPFLYTWGFIDVDIKDFWDITWSQALPLLHDTFVFET